LAVASALAWQAANHHRRHAPGERGRNTGSTKVRAAAIRAELKYRQPRNSDFVYATDECCICLEALSPDVRSKDPRGDGKTDKLHGNNESDPSDYEVNH